MKTNLFVISNLKQLRNFRTLLPFFRTSWGVGVLNSAIFSSFHNRVEFRMIWGGLQDFEGGVWTAQTPPPPSRYLPGLQLKSSCLTRNLKRICDWHRFLNLLTPNVNYSWRTAPLTSKVTFYIFIQQI